ncbi:hypothetical protein [Aeromonas jandaei]|uniref:hypothetical protein n=1 Tax=Aeromonas jandaei TaxID=650 RepID=UPI003F78EAFC
MKLDYQLHDVSYQLSSGNSEPGMQAGSSADGFVTVFDGVRSWKRLWDKNIINHGDVDARASIARYYFNGRHYVHDIVLEAESDTGKWHRSPVVNIVEQQKIQYGDLVNSYIDELFVCLYADRSEVGESSKFKDLMIELYQENQLAFLEAYQKLWLKLYEGSDDDVLCLLIVKSALIPYSYFSSHAKVMVCGCASHQSVTVQESLLKAVDMWGDPEFISILEQMRPFDFKWLEDYRQRVIECLKRKRYGVSA